MPIISTREPREINPKGQMCMDIIYSKSKPSWCTLHVSRDGMFPDYLDEGAELMDYALERVTATSLRLRSTATKAR
jgi:hypothetical protein